MSRTLTITINEEQSEDLKVAIIRELGSLRSVMITEEYQRVKDDKENYGWYESREANLQAVLTQIETFQHHEV